MGESKQKRVIDFVESKSSLIRYALNEFKYAGWMDNECIFDAPDESEQRIFGMNMQEKMCVHLLELLQLISDEGHSGTSMGYMLSIFDRLARFKPLGPIEGKDDEWCEVSKDLFQNKRCSSIFKDANSLAWDVEGRTFIDENGQAYQNIHSRKTITFPYNVPNRIEYVKENEYRAAHPEEYADEKTDTTDDDKITFIV